MENKKKGIKSTVTGIVFIAISLCIFVLSEYVYGGIKEVFSVPSFMIGGFGISGFAFLGGNDKLINKLIESFINILNRFK